MKRFFRNTGGAIIATVLALVGVSTAYAWGPERATFTMEKPASYVTFDSITDNQSSESVGIGDERNFVRVRKAGETTFTDQVEISDADADTIISKIESTKTFLTGTGAVNYDALTDAQIDEFIVKCNDIVGVINLKLFYDKATRTVTIVDADGKTVFSATNVGANGNKNNDKPRNSGNNGGNSGNNGGNSGNNGGNSGNNGGNGSGTVVDDNPIKRTGIDFNIPGVTSVAGTGVLLVSAAGVCLIKKKKSAVREDV